MASRIKAAIAGLALAGTAACGGDSTGAGDLDRGIYVYGPTLTPAAFPAFQFRVCEDGQLGDVVRLIDRTGVMAAANAAAVQAGTVELWLDLDHVGGPLAAQLAAQRGVREAVVREVAIIDRADAGC